MTEEASTSKSARVKPNVDDLDSEYFETESEAGEKQNQNAIKMRSRDDLAYTKPFPLERKRKPNKQEYVDEIAGDKKKSKRNGMLAMNAYDRHRMLINHYLLCFPGATKLLQRDTTNDRTDRDVLKSHHKFIWDDDTTTKYSWEQRLAKKYYDKLFKEYGIADLTRYKENKVALRWRTEKEVIVGKGQFTCGNKKCEQKENLTSWELNFAYIEDLQKKNALVKIRLCPYCSKKLNYHTQKRQAKNKSSRTHIPADGTKVPKPELTEVAKGSDGTSSEAATPTSDRQQERLAAATATELWSKLPTELDEDKTRDDEFAEFLEELFL